MGTMIVVQIFQDIDTLRTQSLSQRIANHSLTSIELILAWGLIGTALYGLMRWRGRPANAQIASDEYEPKVELPE